MEENSPLMVNVKCEKIVICFALTNSYYLGRLKDNTQFEHDKPISHYYV